MTAQSRQGRAPETLDPYPTYPRVLPLTLVADQILGLDRGDVYKMARGGDLPGAFKVGRRWYVSVVAMITSMEIGARETPHAKPSAGAASPKSGPAEIDFKDWFDR